MHFWILLQVATVLATCHVVDAGPVGPVGPAGPVSTTYRVQMVSQGDDGAYDFAYDTGDGNYHIESRHSNGTITGKFAFLSPDGVLREIGYTADDGGFRPEGDLNPPTPIRGKKTHPPPFNEIRSQDRPRLEPPKTVNQPPPPSSEPLPHRRIHSFERAQHQQLISGPLPRAVESFSISTSLPLTSKPPFPIAPLLSSGINLPTSLQEQPKGPSHEDDNEDFYEPRKESNVSPVSETPSSILLSALSQLTETESTPQLPPVNVPSQGSRQGSRLRQVRLKLLQLITLLEEMEVEEEIPNQRRSGRQTPVATPTESRPSPSPAKTPVPSAPIQPKDKQQDSESNRFPTAESTAVVRRAPMLETPLFTPVEGVRQIDGQRFLERSYIPLTRRYGYVYSQEQTQ